MNVKKKIKDELDTFTVTVVGVYGELITEDIPEAELKQSVEKVTKAKDFAQENLEYLAQEIVSETIASVKESEEAKAARVKSLLPADVAVSADPVVDMMATTAVDAHNQKIVEDAGVTTPLPRDVNGPTDAFVPPNMDHLVEAAEQAVKNQGVMGGGGAGLVDVDMNVEVNHDLLTVADENRIAQGLPPKGKGPVIAVAGQPLNQKPKEEPKKEDPGYGKEMRQIGKLAAKYVNSDITELAMFADAVVTIVEDATGENFTESQEEETSA